MTRSAPQTGRAAALRRPAERVAAAVAAFGDTVAAVGHLARSCLRGGGPAGRERFLATLTTLGAGSLVLVAVAAFFSGMVIALQAAVELTRFGATPLVSGIVTVTFVRELGPIFTGLLLAGKGGAGLAAEFGGHLVSGQLLAMRALSIDPDRVLVAPSVRAVVLSVVLLTVVADLAGVLGGLVLLHGQFALSPVVFLNEAVRALAWTDLVSGAVKSLGFGVIVALAGAYYGLRRKAHAEALGRDTMHAVVVASFLVLVSDHVFTRALVALLGG